MQALEALGWQTLPKCRLLHCYVLIYKYVNRLIDFNFDVSRNCNIKTRTIFTFLESEEIMANNTFFIRDLPNGRF